MDANTAAFWQTVIAVANFIVLTATLITLILYTKYTYNMQKAVSTQVSIASEQTVELIHQRKLSILPSFICYPLKPQQSNRINLFNMGKGVAINITIDDVPIVHEANSEARIVFPPIPYLNPDKEIHPGLDYAGLGDRNQQNTAMNSSPIENYLNFRDYSLTIRFTDIEGNGYQQTLKMNNGKCCPLPVKPAV